ncbi:hypothetical protein [Flagellimonas sp. 2504JD4-2]
MRGNIIGCQLCFFISLSSVFFAFGQTSTKNDATYQWFDEIVGIENTPLVDGIEYEEEHRVLNEKTKFFKSSDFLNGNVTYKNQSYLGLQLKYDLYEGNVLVRLPNRIGGTTLMLIKDEIQDFTIDGHAFSAIEGKDEEGVDFSGFYEKLFTGTYLELHARYKKDALERRDKKNLYYEFNDGENEHLILYQRKFYHIEGKKDLVKLFPEYKDEIRTHYKRNKTKEKRRAESFMSSLINLIDNKLIASKR